MFDLSKVQSLRSDFTSHKTNLCQNKSSGLKLNSKSPKRFVGPSLHWKMGRRPCQDLYLGFILILIQILLVFTLHFWNSGDFSVTFLDTFFWLQCISWMYSIMRPRSQTAYLLVAYNFFPCGWNDLPQNETTQRFYVLLFTGRKSVCGSLNGLCQWENCWCIKSHLNVLRGQNIRQRQSIVMINDEQASLSISLNNSLKVWFTS